MDSTLWKVNGVSDSDSAAALGLADFALTLNNQQTDRLALNAPGLDFDADALFAYGDAFSLYRGSTRWFAGIVVSGPRFGGPTEERHDYEVAGLWWYLENLTFEQEWRSGESSLSKSHVILGRDIDNNIVTVGAVIQEALDFAIGKGAPFTYSASDLAALSAKPPSDEQTDLACSEVVRKMLRWIPDTVTWFDYSESPPVLHFTRRSAATAVQYDCTDGTSAVQTSIRDRSDLLEQGVIINYERTDNIDGESIPVLQQDIYPEGTVAGFNTATFTINISGIQLSTQSVEVEVEAVGDYTDKAWWTDRVAGLGEKEDLELKSGVVSDAPLASVLIGGQLPDWTGKETRLVTFYGTFSWTDPDTESKVVEGDFSVQLMTTDAESTVYTKELSYTEPEAYPTGLAQALYEALSVLHWQGTQELVEADCTGGVHPGNVVNLTGGLAAWSTMNAVVQQVDFDLETGRTTITFGPPDRLEIADYVSLLNANRKRITLYSGDSRKTGKSSGASDLDTGGATPVSNTTAGDLHFLKFVVSDQAGEDATKQVVIDPSEMKSGQSIVVQADGKTAQFGWKMLEL